LGTMALLAAQAAAPQRPSLPSFRLGATSPVVWDSDRYEPSDVVVRWLPSAASRGPSRTLHREAARTESSLRAGLGAAPAGRVARPAPVIGNGTDRAFRCNRFGADRACAPLRQLPIVTARAVMPPGDWQGDCRPHQDPNHNQQADHLSIIRPSRSVLYEKSRPPGGHLLGPVSREPEAGSSLRI
jgi:hypothetical protein